MKKIVTILSTILLSGALTSCKTDTSITIAIPNDPTNEARALLLLEKNGYITLKDSENGLATIQDIKDNPYNIKFKEIEASQIPVSLSSVDYGVINSNYALLAKLNPITDSLLIEDSFSNYSNIVAVKEGQENTDKIKALKAAICSTQVKEYINNTYSGAVISTVDNPTNGFDETINYETLKNTTITIACSPTPHSEILQEVKNILSTKNINLSIREYDDYIVPNEVVESGEIDANYFQHKPYLDNYNRNTNSSLVSLCAVHVEPMGLYGGKKSTLDIIKK